MEGDGEQGCKAASEGEEEGGESGSAEEAVEQKHSSKNTLVSVRSAEIQAQ